jgi:hypothetical protein
VEGLCQSLRGVTAQIKMKKEEIKEYTEIDNGGRMQS